MTRCSLDLVAAMAAIATAVAFGCLYLHAFCG